MEWRDEGNKELLYSKLALHYKKSMNDMRDRAPGMYIHSEVIWG